jgi:hypothetical protein
VVISVQSLVHHHLNPPHRHLLSSMNTPALVVYSFLWHFSFVQQDVVDVDSS